VFGAAPASGRQFVNEPEIGPVAFDALFFEAAVEQGLDSLAVAAAAEQFGALLIDIVRGVLEGGAAGEDFAVDAPKVGELGVEAGDIDRARTGTADIEQRLAVAERLVEGVFAAAMEAECLGQFLFLEAFEALTVFHQASQSL
jgi:hypothetical protein